MSTVSSGDENAPLFKKRPLKQYGFRNHNIGKTDLRTTGKLASKILRLSQTPLLRFAVNSPIGSSTAGLALSPPVDAVRRATRFP
jgi:hypothetical protein